jgi:cytochrome c553
MSTLEIPLATPVGSPKHVSADYYYRIPIRPIYKSYPVYVAGHEPPGYIESLRKQEPIITWDSADHRPPLVTQADWIKAGESVFDAPIAYGFTVALTEPTSLYVRESDWLKRTGSPVTRDGVLPFYRYVIRTKDKVEIGILACAMCHTRVMTDGSIIKGAQGNFPFDRAAAYEYRLANNPAEARLGERSLFAVPWLRPNPQAALPGMSVESIAATHDAIPPGVLARHNSSPLYPPHIPDLIGVKDRLYLDATGLQQQRSIVDLMRYAALNQGADFLSDYGGFVPLDFPDFKALPSSDKAGERYSDEQLYALALYVYSLRPPANPNLFNVDAMRGKKVFKNEGCISCHTPPLYTSNKLTLAKGFTPPPDHFRKYDIIPVSVNTDSDLTLKTRRGTGYYKVPSLKGVWFRGMFGHNGWCATLEDWFDPDRTRADYVPTGFKGLGVKTRAIEGHPFGLGLSQEDRKALISFLKTL